MIERGEKLRVNDVIRLVQIDRMIRSTLYRRVADKLRGYPNIDVLIGRGLSVGENVFIGDGVYIDPSHCWLIEIGSEAVISFRTTILAHDASARKHLGYSRVDRVSIGRKAYIGCGAIILPGVTIGEESVVGAGAVVAADVPARTVAAGTPARPICSLEDFLAKHQRAMSSRPCWPLHGWTIPGGISEANKRTQRELLADGCGYVE